MSITQQLINLLQTCVEILSTAHSDKGLNDGEAINAILLVETRMLYKNNALTLKVQSESSDIKDRFIAVHNKLKGNTTDNSTKESIEDIMQLVGE